MIEAGDEVRAERLRWEDVAAYLKHDDRMLMAIGAVEQHGPHLAMGTDTMTAEAVAEDAGRRAGVLVYPPLWYGWSGSHMAFPGTATLRAETLMAVIEDVVESLSAHGFRRFVLVNGNRRANLPPMQIAATRLTEAGGRLVAVADVAYLATDTTPRLRHSEPGGIGHAGEMETSHMLHIHPELVCMDKAEKRLGQSRSPQTTFLPSDPAHAGDDCFFVPRHAKQFAEATGGIGVAGDPTVATAETGANLHAAMVDGLIRILDAVKGMPIPGEK